MIAKGPISQGLRIWIETGSKNQQTRKNQVPELNSDIRYQSFSVKKQQIYYVFCVFVATWPGLCVPTCPLISIGCRVGRLSGQFVVATANCRRSVVVAMVGSASHDLSNKFFSLER